ncbi:MAG: transcriptional regulator NrdR [Candidatus Nanoarchaeia archaeon]
MRCPFCNTTDTKVVDKRDSEGTESIRRRRECLKCNNRFTTYERIESISLRIIKKDGARQEFDREKILKGMLKACEKRHVTNETINNAVKEIENELWTSGESEVSSKKIGSLIMKKLRKIDKVAYIRFASVYREFKDIEEFHKEVQKLVAKSTKTDEAKREVV